jgi:hypothetical protein
VHIFDESRNIEKIQKNQKIQKIQKKLKKKNNFFLDPTKRSCYYCSGNCCPQTVLTVVHTRAANHSQVHPEQSTLTAVSTESSVQTCVGFISYNL